MSRRPRLGRWLPWLAGLGTILLLAAAALALVNHTGNVSHPDVEFRSQPAPPTPPEPKRKQRGEPSFEWPVFGYDKARTGEFRVRNPTALHPPYRRTWTYRGHSLLEFPPVLGRRSLFVLRDNGSVYALARRTGKVVWRRKLGHLAASSPAYAHNTVFALVLARSKNVAAGRITALDAKDGRTRWSRKLPSRAESSPLVDHGRVYFGTEDGTVYSLNASNGRITWTYHARGAVKAALAMDGDRNLYVGDYSGAVQSIRARDGSLRWRTSTRTALGFGGNFYATPAVAYGRVYVGSTDGSVYSFGASTGKLAWRHATGAYVYSSPSVAHVPGSRPSVFIGSYDGKLYALDARSGATRWTRSVGGRISGGTVVIGDLVFYSTLNHVTGAVGARTGRQLWRIGEGAFNPAVSDGRRIYLVGRDDLFALTPRRAAPAKKAKPKHRAKRRHHAKRQHRAKHRRHRAKHRHHRTHRRHARHRRHRRH